MNSRTGDNIEEGIVVQRVAIILAAGVSSRMNTDVPKVLHKVCGRAMLAYVLDACREVGSAKIYVVVGYGAEKVKERFAESENVIFVRQQEQKGTAHAVLCCKEYLQDFEGQVLILCGDGPLIRSETLKAIIKKHEAERSSATLATAVLDEPAGYGRVIRDAHGDIQQIVEDGDCTGEQLAVKEVNPSYYLFDNKVLFEVLEKVRADNVKKEYYLTDVLSLIITAGHKVAAVTAVRPEEAMSVNTKAQLDKVNKIMQCRIQQKA